MPEGQAGDPNVLHVHEWQCSAGPRCSTGTCIHAQGLLNNAKVMLTIHNMDNTGECREEGSSWRRASPEASSTRWRRLWTSEPSGTTRSDCAWMKGAIAYSNYVTTVSPTYAREALNGSARLPGQDAHEGADEVSSGVINGGKRLRFGTRAGQLPPANFKPGTMEGKALCKKYLQMGLGMNVDPHAAGGVRLPPGAAEGNQPHRARDPAD